MSDTDDPHGRRYRNPNARPAAAALLGLTDGVPPPSRIFGGLTARLDAGAPVADCRGALTMLLWLSREAAVPLDDLAAAVPLLAPPLRATALEWLLTVADADGALPALPPDDDLFAGVDLPPALVDTTLMRAFENASMVNVAGAAAPRMNASIELFCRWSLWLADKAFPQPLDRLSWLVDNVLLTLPRPLPDAARARLTALAEVWLAELPAADRPTAAAVLARPNARDHLDADRLAALTGSWAR